MFAGICILKGCSVPVVLRPQKSESGIEYYEFLGACYLHTMMDGKAIEEQELLGLEMKTFELR